MKIVSVQGIAWTALLLCSCSGDDKQAPEHSSRLSDNKREQDHPIRLSLETLTKTIKNGEIPKFRFTIHNQGATPQRILDLRDGRRGDLEDTYCCFEFSRDGKAIYVPRIISDPGPLAESDFMTLSKGETVTLQFEQFPQALNTLLPGKYGARIKFWQDPYQSHETIILSPMAEFTVVE